jgi:UDP-N-acetylmuramyl tripeptide synthase
MNSKNIKASNHIPMFAVTGTNGKTTTARLLYHLLTKLGFTTGLACTGSVIIGDKTVEEGDTTGFLSARRILMDNSVEAAVFETARGGIINNGLGYENIDAAIITTLSEDHMGLNGIHTLEELGEVKTVLLDEVRTNGKWVLKAQKELLDIAMKYRKEDVSLCLFNYNKSDLIKDHIKYHGEAFYVESHYLIHNIGGIERKLADVSELAFAYNGLSKSNVLNIMACLGALGIILTDLQPLVSILKELPCDLKHNSGRQNLIRYEGYSLMLDYGHNREAYEEVFSIVKGLKPEYVTSIITAPGDRNDKHIEELGYIAGLNSNRIIVREQQDCRGSQLGRVASLLMQGAVRAGLKEDQIININNAEEALKYSMERAVLNEVIVLYIEDLDSVQHVI